MGASPVWWIVLLVVRSGGPSSKSTGSRVAVVFDIAQRWVPGSPAKSGAGQGPGSREGAGLVESGAPSCVVLISDRSGSLGPVPDVPEDARLAAEVVDALQVRTGGEQPRALEQREPVGLVEGD